MALQPLAISTDNDSAAVISAKLIGGLLLDHPVFVSNSESLAICYYGAIFINAFG